MAKVVYSVLPLMLLLTGCERDYPSDELARHIVSECGLTVDSIQGEYGFDYVGIAIIVKKVPEAEFNRKLRCVRAIFFMRRLRAHISNGSQRFEDEVVIG
ncbi:hypothetical protein U1839_24785 [Sphingomonas sp. RT2P30]|uniref:hypothetical protein n=1 Tax=Parasphingomonas halimpatiens TaxID=3096162 RepID=UPI002FCB0E06